MIQAVLGLEDAVAAFGEHWSIIPENPCKSTASARKIKFCWVFICFPYLCNLPSGKLT